MIRINQIKMNIRHTKEDLLLKTAHILQVDRSMIKEFRIAKQSIDARKKPEIFYIYAVDVVVEKEEFVIRKCKNSNIAKINEKKYEFPVIGTKSMKHRPVIIGTGPAGLFCGYFLAKYGYAPILLERGKNVEKRLEDVNSFWEKGELNTESNVQFGEGGAGTFSDGKLNTLVKDKFGRNREVLQIFVDCGAPDKILYESKPHIGTDVLAHVVKSMRNEIIRMGGEVRFSAKVTDFHFENSSICAIEINGEEVLACENVVLAIGHSARDTFEKLNQKGVPMEQKAFAVGLRMEHPREFINYVQYGRQDDCGLPTASYKVTAQTKDGRGVYSFCMCPGGFVVNASSEKGRLAVNGMSYSDRMAKNSNSAMIVTVTPKDFESDDALAGVEFQRKLEQKAYIAGDGLVPVQTYGDYKEAVTGEKAAPSVIREKYPDFVPQIKGGYKMAKVHEILPPVLNRALVEGIEQIGNHIPGFADTVCYLSGIESRTSSPVRITRDETGQSAIKGLFPCGEGAGYAGGITSAAMDGILIAEKIATIYNNC